MYKKPYHIKLETKFIDENATRPWLQREWKSTWFPNLFRQWRKKENKKKKTQKPHGSFPSFPCFSLSVYALSIFKSPNSGFCLLFLIEAVAKKKIPSLFFHLLFIVSLEPL